MFKIDSAIYFFSTSSMLFSQTLVLRPAGPFPQHLPSISGATDTGRASLPPRWVNRWGLQALTWLALLSRRKLPETRMRSFTCVQSQKFYPNQFSRKKW